MQLRFLFVALLGFLPQDDGGTKFKLNVNQVIVPVAVSDAKGHRLSGFRAEDFELLEDGVAQKITSFSEGGVEVQAPAGGGGAKAASSQDGSKPANAAPAPIPATEQIGRTYAICVDTLHSNFPNFPPVRTALEKFFEKENRTDSQYWLVSLGKKPEVLQYPTANPHDVLKVLRDKKFLATIQNSEASALGAQIGQVRRQLDEYCGRCPCGRDMRPAPMECVGPRQSIFGLVTTSANRTRIYTEFFLKELKAVVVDLSHMPGNRVLILVSDGFNLVPGRELYGVMRAYFPQDDRWQISGQDTTAQLEPILREAAANNIVVYGISSNGLGSTAGVGGAFEASTKGTSVRGTGQVILADLNRQAAQATFESGTAMEMLAKATGGAFIENTNDVLQGILRAFNETRNYYVLGYVSSNPAADGKYRAIEVKVRDPKALVRAREGYWARRSGPNGEQP
jgi:VWFA-related protein